MLVTIQTFGLAELSGLTFTVWVGPNETELFSLLYIAFSKMATFGILILTCGNLTTCLIPKDPALRINLYNNFQEM